MTLHLDDRYMFRDALDGIHGLDPSVRGSVAARFADVMGEVKQRTASGEYGFTTLGHQPDLLARLAEWSAPLQGRFDQVLVLGIGGSALGPKALIAALKSPEWNSWSSERRRGFPALTVLDNVDPVTVGAALDGCDPRRTLVNVISKSGGTTETLAQYLVVRAWLEATLGVATARDHLVITTDPARGALRTLANEERIVAFDVPPSIGGRYSVLTAVGLVPAALVGIDCTALLEGAQDAVDEAKGETLDGNPAARWAARQWQAQATRAANIHVMMPYSDRLRPVAEWYRQLWAESLGKRKDREDRDVFRGPTPVGAVGTTDQHSQLQLFMAGPFDKTITFIRVLETVNLLPIPSRAGLDSGLSYLPGTTLGTLLDAELIATREALRSQGRMSMTLEIDTVDARNVGRLMMFLQLAAGYAGVWYDVNPFDQPGVELEKELTVSALRRSNLAS